jgi:hypothetical protein
MTRTKKAWAIISRHGRLRAYLGFSDGNLRTLYEFHCAYRSGRGSDRDVEDEEADPGVGDDPAAGVRL